ncbi:MAG: hypothetical protein AAF449_23865, partial [Myxococcota bacterium]
VATSFNGVYERQFGLQGFLACVGLFFLTATSIRGKRGAWMSIGVLAIVGSTIGIYALFQAFGWDPYPFFWNRPHNKVYSFLGNATFAGNALALVLPLVAVAGSVATAYTIACPQRRSAAVTHASLWALGFFGVLFAQIVPGRMVALSALSLEPVAKSPPSDLTLAFKFGLIIAAGLLIGGALFGTWGPRSTRLESQKGRFGADAVAAGALTAMVVGMFFGLLFTRTRGAWVGTAVALGVGLILFPLIAKGTRYYTPMVRIFGGTAAAIALAFTVYVFAPGAVCGPRDKGACWTYAETIRSIPAAFDPNRTDYGKGQGTRRYLWSESPRVLFNHTETLQRYYDDRADYAQYVTEPLQREFGLDSVSSLTDNEKSFDRTWRSIGVWLFGIGIETYRYAFMSHKSMLLEKLDPMTNHDNPHNNYLYVLASFGLAGLAAYVWLLITLLGQAFRRFTAAESPWTDRAMAFGVVLSFFSYSVYSIAGFDSVACSVFLFFLLGAAAALFVPNIGEIPEPLANHLWRQGRAVAGRKTEGAAPGWMPIAVAVLMVPLLLL